jgi:hypothetical protein
MSTTHSSYVEHSHVEAHGFSVTDAKPGEHYNDQIWVGYHGDGRWLTAHEALCVAAAIERAATAQLARAAQQPIPPYQGVRKEFRRPSYLDLSDDYCRSGDIEHSCGEFMDAPRYLPSGSHVGYDYEVYIKANGIRHIRSGE